MTTLLKYRIPTTERTAMKRSFAGGLQCLVLLSVAFFNAPNLWAANQFWQDPGVDDWFFTNNGNGGNNPNWSDQLVPPNQFIPDQSQDEIGTINNGGTAYVSIAPDGGLAQPNPGGVLLGQGPTDSGNVEIRPGGLLDAQIWRNGVGPEGGDVVIGQNGTGVLTVERGGTLSGERIIVGGAEGSLLSAGAGNSGTATILSRGNMLLNRSTTIIGPNVNALAEEDIVFGPESIYTAVITDATNHSPLRAVDSITAGGQFRVEFGNGVTPALGDSWPVLDASSVVGNFSNVDSSAAPQLGTAQTYRLRPVDGGTYGEQLRLEVAQQLTLEVDWDSKNITIRNQGSSANVSIDGYSIISGFGSLDPDSWTSLESEGEPGGWLEAGPTANSLSELRPSGTTPLGPDASRNLGAAFAPAFPEFGVDPEELRFEYREADGVISQGLVEYSGEKVHNNLLLGVEPSTGEAVLKNDSPFEITISGYSVLSDSGSLLTGWNSLADQGVLGWEEASPTTSSLSELAPLQSSALVLPAGISYNLGTLFNTGGSQDLSLEFLLTGNTAASIGDVIYSLPSVGGLTGDYNGDNVVNLADYTIWRDSLGVRFPSVRVPTAIMME